MFGHLPPEIVEDILQRLPFKSLVRSTSVCKAWNTLITSQTFISHHLNRSIHASNGNNNISLLFHFKRSSLYPHDLHYEDFFSIYSSNQQSDHHLSVERFPLSHLFRPHRSTPFVGTCNGLICSAHYSPFDSAAILIWNPLLRKYVVLPKPIMTSNKRDRHHYNKYVLCYGFGFDSSNNDYKVVRFMNNYSGQGTTPYVDVYSLVSHSWRSIGDVKVPRIYFYPSYYGGLHQVFVNGAVHWVALRHKFVDLERHGCDDLERAFILSFDVTEETFREIPLPKQSTEKECVLTNLIAVEGGHSLAVVNYRLKINKYRRSVCNVWVMKEYGITESWTEIFHCSGSRYGGISGILALTRSGKVVIRLENRSIILVDISKKSVEPLGEEYIEAYAGTFVESLFFIDKQPNLLSF